jgi:hypothetical protein
VVPERFQARVVLVNTTSGQAHELSRINGVAVQGTHRLHPTHGLYHFVLRHDSQYSLVTVSLDERGSRARGLVRTWSDERFRELHSLHCLHSDESGSDEFPCRLVGMFPSPGDTAPNPSFLDLWHIGEAVKELRR